MRQVFAGLLIAAAVHGAAAQEFPVRPVRIVVPSPPGAVTDILARVIAQNLQQAWGKPVIVENRPGADEMIAADVVAKSPADGHTLLVTSNGGVTAAPHLHKDIKYDALKDFMPLHILGQVSPVFSVPAASSVKSVQDLIALAKAKPGVLNYGSYGNGSYAHVAMEDFKQRTGVDIVHVPYRGAAPVVTALLQNEIAVLVVNIGTIGAYVEGGTARNIAAAGAKRSVYLPNLPTVAESGVPGFATGAWWGLFGPVNMPASIAEKIRADVDRALASPEAKRVYETSTLERMIMTPPEMVQFHRDEFDRWGRLITANGIKLE